MDIKQKQNQIRLDKARRAGAWRFRGVAVVAGIIFLAAGPGARAQLPSLGKLFGPHMLASHLDIEIPHPPSLTLRLSLKSVALGRPEGECSNTVQSAIEEDFVNSGVTVVDRSHLDSVMREFKIDSGGLIDEKTAAKVGQMLGAQALIFLQLHQCMSNQLYSGQGQYITYTTRSMVKGSLRVIDLASGRVVAAQHIEGTRDAQSTEGYPDNTATMDGAQKDAAESVHHMFFKWTEKKHVVFFDHSDCGMKDASALLKAQDLDGALHKAQGAMDECQAFSAKKKRPELMSHLYYDIGLLQFLKADYDNSIQNLTKASQGSTDETITNALNDSKTAKKHAEEIAREAEEDAMLAGRGSGNLSATQRKTSTGPGGSSAAAKLKELQQMLKDGLITKPEYDEKRREILKSM